MNTWKHLNFEQRKLINHFLSKNIKSKLCEIADILQLDPTTISKEIKRNRLLTHKGNVQTNVCKYTARFPYVCNGCNKKYGTCTFPHYKYDPKIAQHKYEEKLVRSRSGLDMSVEEYTHLDNTIKNGVDNKESIYHIIKDNPELEVSVSTVYRLINEGKLRTKRIDLPYAVTYKKRKSNKQYEYKENNRIDRTNRSYLDFLAYKLSHPHEFHVQIDFLGKIKTDKKSIFVITIPDLHFPTLFLIESPNSQKILDIYNQLEVQLSLRDFLRVFPFILTDRDPNFSKFNEIESSFTISAQRTSLFFCDSFNSCQKANVEQMNKQLRKFFPKGKSIDYLTQEDISKVESIIRNTHVASLVGATPNEAFIKVYGEAILNKLNGF